MSDARDFLDASKRVEEAATAGPWFAGAGWVYYDTGVESDGSWRNRSIFGSKHLLPGSDVTPDPDVQVNVDLVVFARTALPKMRAALEAVLELHPSVPLGALGQYPGEEELPVCEVCDDGSGGYEAWPCPTVQAIQAALAVNDEGGK